MKVYICIVLALVGAATARNVFKMDIPEEEDRVSDNDNALFFSPQKEQVGPHILEFIFTYF